MYEYGNRMPDMLCSTNANIEQWNDHWTVNRIVSIERCAKMKEDSLRCMCVEPESNRNLIIQQIAYNLFDWEALYMRMRSRTWETRAILFLFDAAEHSDASWRLPTQLPAIALTLNAKREMIYYSLLTRHMSALATSAMMGLEIRRQKQVE